MCAGGILEGGGIKRSGNCSVAAVVEATKDVEPSTRMAGEEIKLSNKSHKLPSLVAFPAELLLKRPATERGEEEQEGGEEEVGEEGAVSRGVE